LNAEIRLSRFASDASETERIGESLGRYLKQGALILLFGDLGAGKTTFSRGLGRGMGVPTPIQSPTFALIYEHKGRLPLAHMDFYRLNSPDELDTLGLEEYVEGGGVVLIEWPEIAAARLPESRIEIRIAPEAEGRRLAFAGFGEAADVLRGWDDPECERKASQKIA
jgi:tRNA threonylcarbamoyladenosine biosynthesis protein TsaE